MRPLRAGWAALLLLAWSVAWWAFPARAASPLPVCPSCDCSGDCFTPGCLCEAPLSDAAAADLLEYVREILTGATGGGLDLLRPVTVQAADAEALVLPDGEQALATCGGDVIMVGRWLRRSEALVVLAHEYGHAWQDQHHPDPGALTDRFSEGFAEWTAHLVARRTGYLVSASRIRDRKDPSYGDGVRYFLDWETRLGTPHLLELARTWNDFQGAGRR